MSTTQNMGLTVPDVSVTTGPQWAQQINSDLSIIDSHNHTPGSGVQIPTAGIDINDDLSFNQSYSPLDVKSVGFTSQGSTISSLINRVYVSGGNLYFNNGSGTPVQITTGSSIVGASGTITGTGFTASFATDTFSWRVTSGSLNANMDCGPVLIRPPTAGAFGIQLESPATLVGNEVLQLPARPASQSLVAMSSGGVQTTATVNSTLTLTSNSLSVATGGITSSQLSTSPAAVATTNIQPLAVTTAKIADGNVTQAKLGPKTISQSSGVSSGVSTISTSPTAIPGMSVAFTARAGYPIKIEAIGTSGGSSYLNFSAWGTIDMNCSGPSGPSIVSSMTTLGASRMGVNSICGIFTPSANGVHTFSLDWFLVSSGVISLAYAKLVAYEI
jgi:hypothetical protein